MGIQREHLLFEINCDCKTLTGTWSLGDVSLDQRTTRRRTHFPLTWTEWNCFLRDGCLPWGCLLCRRIILTVSLRNRTTAATELNVTRFVNFKRESARHFCIDKHKLDMTFSVEALLDMLHTWSVYYGRYVNTEVYQPTAKYFWCFRPLMAFALSNTAFRILVRWYQFCNVWSKFTSVVNKGTARSEIIASSFLLSLSVLLPLRGRSAHFGNHCFRRFLLSSAKCARSQWPRGLRHVLSSLALSLGSWVRIPLKAWMSVFMLSCV
jgi:hypothetical protein